MSQDILHKQITEEVFGKISFPIAHYAFRTAHVNEYTVIKIFTELSSIDPSSQREKCCSSFEVVEDELRNVTSLLKKHIVHGSYIFALRTRT